tara:strand:- start:317 stop:535 length:219 start_codon:yes stop_codon:yes gene_type:complete
MSHKEILFMEKHNDSRIFESLSSLYPELANAALRLQSMNASKNNQCWILKQVKDQSTADQTQTRAVEERTRA